MNFWKKIDEMRAGPCPGKRFEVIEAYEAAISYCAECIEQYEYAIQLLMRGKSTKFVDRALRNKTVKAEYKKLIKREENNESHSIPF